MFLYIYTFLGWSISIQLKARLILAKTKTSSDSLLDNLADKLSWGIILDINVLLLLDILFLGFFFFASFMEAVKARLPLPNFSVSVDL